MSYALHEGFSSYIPKETFLVAMAISLIAVSDIDNPEQRCEAYIRAGYTDEEILEHDTECARRETIRRSIYNLKEKARA